MTIGYVKHQCEGEQRSNVRHYIDITLRTFSPNTGKYGPEKTPHLDTFHAVSDIFRRLWGKKLV